MTTGQASDSSARASATSFSDVTNALTASRAQIGDDVEPSPDARQSAKWRERQRVQTSERVVPSRRDEPGDQRHTERRQAADAHSARQDGYVRPRTRPPG
jgi:hypothetical protein